MALRGLVGILHVSCGSLETSVVRVLVAEIRRDLLYVQRTMIRTEKAPVTGNLEAGPIFWRILFLFFNHSHVRTAVACF